MYSNAGELIQYVLQKHCFELWGRTEELQGLTPGVALKDVSVLKFVERVDCMCALLIIVVGHCYKDL